MSSILKALRKLQEDKAALGEGNIDIARDIHISFSQSCFIFLKFT